MSTTTLTTAHREAVRPAYDARPAPAPTPFHRLLGVELRKMFDTRSGAWLMASIVLTALVATVAVVALAPAEVLTYDTFVAAVGLPMVTILPIVALLSVTSEWSQRTGLTTFTLVPHRGRVVAAKAVCALGIGVVAVVLAAAIGAVGNVVGASLAGVDLAWDLGAARLAAITLATVLNMFIGFMLGLLLRSSAAALVGYFVYQFVLTGLTALLAVAQPWFADLQPWVDFNFSQGQLFEVVPSAEQWAQLGVSGFFWLVLPLAVGLRLVLRSEVK